MSIYVRDADGNRQKIAGVGLPGPAGKSAYQYAVEGGFSGTEEEFKALVGIRSNPNLLDNAFWANRDSIINQRGQTEYTASEGDDYYIDRWTIGWGGKAEIVDDGILFTANSTRDFSTLNTQQKLPAELESYVSGKIVTCSIMYSTIFTGLSFGMWDTWVPLVPTNNKMNVVSTSFEWVPGRTVAIATDIPGAQIAVAAMKLELGPVQTLAHKEGDTWVLNDLPPNKALELAKCQRYQFVINPQQLYAKFGIAVSHDIDMVFADVALPVPLRALPAIQVTNVNNIRFIRCGPMEAQIPITNVSLNSIIGNIIYLNIEVHGISLGDYGFMDFSSTDARIVLDANL